MSPRSQLIRFLVLPSLVIISSILLLQQTRYSYPYSIQPMASHLLRRSLPIIDRLPLLNTLCNQLPSSPSLLHSPFHRNLSISQQSRVMDSAKPFLDATKARRSLYQLSAESPISDARIEEIVNHSVLHTPGPFNAQSGRVVVLLKKDHVKLWDFTMEILKAMLPAEKFEQSAPRLEGFRAGYGTVNLPASLPS